MATQRKIEGQGYFGAYEPIIGTNMFIKTLSVAAGSNLSQNDRMLAHYFREAVASGAVLESNSGITQEQRTQITKRGFTIYLLPENCNLPINEAVKQNIATIVSPLPFSIANQSINPQEGGIVPQIDEAGNLILKLANYPLENMGPGGNVLITRDGKLMQNYDDHGFIHPINIETNLYPVTIYEQKMVRGAMDTVGTKYNYLYPDGRQVFVSHIERTQNPTIMEMPAKRSKIKFTRPGSKKEMSIYSPRYIYDVGTSTIGHYQRTKNSSGVEAYTPDLYPTVIDLLIANRSLKTPMIEDDRELVLKAHKRYQDMSTIFSLLNNKLQNGSIPQEQYDEIMRELKDEIEKTDYFLSNMETDQDRALFEEAEDDFVF